MPFGMLNATPTPSAPPRPVPGPNDTQTSGTWGTDKPFDPRAALGRPGVPRVTAAKGLTSVPGRGMMGFADGTTSVPPDPTAPPAPASAPWLSNMFGQPSGGVPQDPPTMGMPGPGATTYQGADPNTFGQPGGTVPSKITTPPTLGAEISPIASAIIQHFAGPTSVPPPGATHAISGKNAVPAASSLQQAMNAGGLGGTAADVVTHADGTTKPDNNPVGTKVTAALAGSTDGQAHAVNNPHHYTDDEFADALDGVPLHTIEKLWGMQHYLTPQQQIAPRVLHQVDLQTQQLQQAYDALRSTPGSDQTKVKSAFDALNQQKQYFAQLATMMAVGPNASMIGAVPTAPATTAGQTE